MYVLNSRYDKLFSIFKISLPEKADRLVQN